jgi:hypothetical protein
MKLMELEDPIAWPAVTYPVTRMSFNSNMGGLMELTKTRRRVRPADPTLPLVAGDPSAVAGFAIGLFGMLTLLVVRLLAG